MSVIVLDSVDNKTKQREREREKQACCQPAKASLVIKYALHILTKPRQSNLPLRLDSLERL